MMDWITRIQRTIDYIEQNLLDDMDIIELSKVANSSAFHFQRVFHILSGHTISEYIRYRRLTLAANELQTDACKVIDMALKYGYDTPESFSRAFKQFHGITPSAARKPGANLRAFSKLYIKVILEGGSIMDYRIEKKPAFCLLSRAEYQKADNVQVSEFWDKSYSDGTISKLKEYSAISERPIIGLADGSSFDGFRYLYYIGTPYEGKHIPDGYLLREIPAADWIIFRCVDLSESEANEEIFRKIYSEFFPTSDYEPNNDYQLEVFPGDGLEHAQEVSEIWISVRQKLVV
ncbi:AraC family transcriptional regulator [Enterococcus sp. AZ071]|uniref:AraC family transcriptional regulator n=2 Tax=Enterococcus TaxID=1350 RepID=A0ABV0ER69_9ENTE|nr:AraC family transcriptional regulator [Enterococcus sp. 665A]